MGALERLFFSMQKNREVIVKADSERAPLVLKFLGSALIKGAAVNRCGRSTKYFFNFDRVYDQRI